MISIILPTYNRAELISRAIESVINQSYNHWELIIVDDGSSDNTKEVVKRYTDDRILYIYQENQERSAARNRGIQEAKGEWICFLDSDDEFPPERLMVLNEVIQDKRQQRALYFTDITFRSGLENRTINYSGVDKDNTLPYLFRNVIGTPQVCAHREILTEFQFNAKLNNGEDLELWSRIQTKFPFIYLNAVSPVIAHDHSERSVDLRKNNTALSRLTTLQYMFSGDHPANKLEKKMKRRVFSDTQFSIAKHYMFNSNKKEARRWILRSLITDRSNAQRKHRLFCLISLLKGKIPSEYQ